MDVERPDEDEDRARHEELSAAPDGGAHDARGGDEDQPPERREVDEIQGAKNIEHALQPPEQEHDADDALKWHQLVDHVLRVGPFGDDDVRGADQPASQEHEGRDDRHCSLSVVGGTWSGSVTEKPERQALQAPHHSLGEGDDAIQPLSS